MPRDLRTTSTPGSKPSDGGEGAQSVPDQDHSSRQDHTSLGHSISPPEDEKHYSRQSLSSLTRTESPPASRFVTIPHGPEGQAESSQDKEEEQDADSEDVEWEDQDSDVEEVDGDRDFEANDAHFDNAAAAAQFIIQQHLDPSEAGSSGAGRGRSDGRRKGRASPWSQKMRGGASILGQLLMGRDPGDFDDEMDDKPNAWQEPGPLDELHPYVQTLSARDEGACLALEEACWKEGEREGREAVSLVLVFSFLLEGPPLASLNSSSALPEFKITP